MNWFLSRTWHYLRRASHSFSLCINRLCIFLPPQVLRLVTSQSLLPFTRQNNYLFCIVIYSHCWSFGRNLNVNNLAQLIFDVIFLRAIFNTHTWHYNGRRCGKLNNSDGRFCMASEVNMNRRGFVIRKWKQIKFIVAWHSFTICLIVT